jgi:hypothetical protein
MYENTVLNLKVSNNSKELLTSSKVFFVFNVFKTWLIETEEDY